MTAPTPDPTQDPNQDRMEQLEIKLSYAEDLLDTLNALVTQQQGQIDWLLREVNQLRRQREDDAPGAFRSLRDELPPHY